MHAYIHTCIRRLAFIYVAGTNVITLNRVNGAVVAFKLVALNRGIMDYHNNFFVARDLSWIIATQLEEGLPSRVRALPVEMGEVSVPGWRRGPDPFKHTS